MAPRASRGNARTAFVLAGVVAGMVGLTFAAVPLYRMICQATGYGGTPRVAEAAPKTVAARIIKVRFNADVDPRLPWTFEPEQRQVAVHVGETGMAYFRARNNGDRPITGAATFNVTPDKAARYFSKFHCFCFDDQRLAAGQEAEMAVEFFVDPEILADRNLDDVKTITLSYTFFRHAEDAGGSAAGAGDTALRAARASAPAVN